VSLFPLFQTLPLRVSRVDHVLRVDPDCSANCGAFTPVFAGVLAEGVLLIHGVACGVRGERLGEGVDATGGVIVVAGTVDGALGALGCPGDGCAKIGYVDPFPEFSFVPRGVCDGRMMSDPEFPPG